MSKTTYQEWGFAGGSFLGIGIISVIDKLFINGMDNLLPFLLLFIGITYSAISIYKSKKETSQSQ